MAHLANGSRRLSLVKVRYRAIPCKERLVKSEANSSTRLSLVKVRCKASERELQGVRDCLVRDRNRAIPCTGTRLFLVRILMANCG